MALPVAPPPKPKDIAALGWAGVTVRVAWALLIEGVKVRPEVLRDCRAHVLFHLDPTTPQPHAEDLAGHLTAGFVARARGISPPDPWPQDWDMPLSPRWRRAVQRSLDPLSETMFRKHYGDNRSLERLEVSLKTDRATLEAARAGLREVVRRIAVADGLPLQDWSADRLDRLLRRLSAWSPGPCPPILDVVEGCHREHVAGCVRCDRLLRLVRASVVEVDDLFPPSVGARPNDRARVLALQIHPDARRHRGLLLSELTAPAFPIGSDIVLINADDLDAVGPTLRVAAEVNSPGAVHIRGALLEGLGRWTPRGVLGPLAAQAEREVLHRSWGQVEGLGELPDVLPTPPTAKGWWLAVGMLAAVLLLVLQGVFTAPVQARADPIQVDFSPGRGGLWLAFDVPETSLVTIVVERDGALEVALASTSAADKGDLATGDGGYRLHLPADGALLLAHDAPLQDLPAALSTASKEPDALQRLAEAMAGSATGRWGHR